MGLKPATNPDVEAATIELSIDGRTVSAKDGASLYDLQADPEETRNLAGQNHPSEQRLSDLLRRWLAERRGVAAPVNPREPSDEEKARLKALGYG